jgi:hypothetical protein
MLGAGLRTPPFRVSRSDRTRAGRSGETCGRADGGVMRPAPNIRSGPAQPGDFDPNRVRSGPRGPSGRQRPAEGLSMLPMFRTPRAPRQLGSMDITDGPMRRPCSSCSSCSSPPTRPGQLRSMDAGGTFGGPDEVRFLPYQSAMVLMLLMFLTSRAPGTTAEHGHHRQTDATAMLLIFTMFFTPRAWRSTAEHGHPPHQRDLRVAGRWLRVGRDNSMHPCRTPIERSGLPGPPKPAPGRTG